MTNRREHDRIPIKLSVKISHPAIGERVVKTQNISDSGLFVLIEPSDLPPIDSIVVGQVQGMIDEPPKLGMKIVRSESHGVGLMFVPGEVPEYTLQAS